MLMIASILHLTIRESSLEVGGKAKDLSQLPLNWVDRPVSASALRAPAPKPTQFDPILNAFLFSGSGLYQLTLQICHYTLHHITQGQKGKVELRKN